VEAREKRGWVLVLMSAMISAGKYSTGRMTLPFADCCGDTRGRRIQVRSGTGHERLGVVAHSTHNNAVRWMRIVLAVQRTLAAPATDVITLLVQ